MATRFYNTLAHEMQDFVPMAAGKEAANPLAGSIIKMYTCGPTVYDYAHIGNFRAFLFADVLRRYLEFRGATVHQVMNMTDVGHMTEDTRADAGGQDKMELAGQKLKEAKKSGRVDEGAVANPDDPREVAQFFVDRFLEDARSLQLSIVLERDHTAQSDQSKLMPRPTEFIPSFIDMIQTLIANDHAYIGTDGVVYYSVSSFPSYGKLSGNSVEQLSHGAGGRTNETAAKKHPADFFLWKPDASHIMRWPSPWGEGYPGWHIECSAMATRLLGDSIDIHTGGEDNIFPHHECEIAQSEAATGKQFSKFWMHTRHLMVDGAKMSKSKGNFFTIRDLVAKGFDPLAIRFALINTRYRESMDFSLKGLFEAASAVTTLRDLADKLIAQILLTLPGGIGAHPGVGALIAKGAAQGFLSYELLNDLLPDEAIAPDRLEALMNMFNALNIKLLNEAGGSDTLDIGVEREIMLLPDDQKMLHDFTIAMDDDLNIAGALGALFVWAAALNKTKKFEYTKARSALTVLKKIDHVLGVIFPPLRPLDAKLVTEVETLVAERAKARSNKEWAKSDELRAQLATLGIVVKDTPTGSVWTPALAPPAAKP